MAKGSRVNLTSTRIAATACPAGASETKLWDAVVPGLVVRIYASGRKTFFLRYRLKGGGRHSTPRHFQIGDVGAISLADARAAARQKLGEVAAGGDPAAVRREDKRQEQARLGAALDRYEKSLVRRHVVKRKDTMSLLRRELLKPLGNVDLAELDRNKLVQRISSVEESGRPGAAQDLRSKAAVFLGWAADTGLITASPLAGWRRKRRTRAERLEQAGRALEDAEIPIFWRAATETDFPFGPYLKLLLLLMQRRTETSLMRWPHLDLRAGEWTVPPEITKSGRAHRVPVPPPAVAILEAMPRLAGTDLVFPGRRGRGPGSPASNGRSRLSIRPMSGWSKRLPLVYERTAAAGMKPWTPHDLRRTARTGLGRLGVDRVVSELLLDHAVSDELAKIYDRGDYWHLRVEAAARWAAHVTGLVEGDNSQVVPLRSTA